MLENFIENGKAMYVIGILGILGILFQSIISIFYAVAIKEANNMNSTKRKLLKQIKLKYESCFRLKAGVNNSCAFVEKYLLKGRICGLAVGKYENIGILMGLLVTAIGIGCAVYCFINGTSMNLIVLYISIGILGLVGLTIYGFVLNIWGKRKLLVASITDYLDNILSNRLISEIVVSREDAPVLSERLVSPATEIRNYEDEKKNIKDTVNVQEIKNREETRNENREESREENREENRERDVVRNYHNTAIDNSDEKIISDIIKEFLT